MRSQQAPDFDFDIEEAVGEITLSEQSVLICTQGSGTNPDKGLMKNVSEAMISDLAGKGSLAHRSFLRFRKYNPVTPIDFITYNEPSTATKAKAGISIGGTAETNGSIRIIVADSSYVFEIDIVKDDTAEIIGQKIEDKINASDVPFLANRVLNPVRIEITYGIGGLVGNGLSVIIDSEFSGLQITSTDFTGGTVNYDSELTLDNLKKRYSLVIFDETIKAHYVAKWLDDRFNAGKEILAGNAITMVNTPFSGIEKIADDIRDVVDGKSITIFANCDEQKYAAIPILFLAELAAKITLRLTDGADLRGVVKRVSGESPVGGIRWTTIPIHNTPMSYLPSKGELSADERDKAYREGISLMVDADDGISTVIGKVRTLANTAKVFNTMNGVQATFAVREYFSKGIGIEYPQASLSTSKSAFDARVANYGTINATCQFLFNQLISKGVLENTAKARALFNDTLNIEIKKERLGTNINFKAELLGQFEGAGGTITVSLTAA